MYKWISLLTMLVLALGCQVKDKTSKVMPVEKSEAKASVVKTESSDDITLDYCMGKFDPDRDNRFEIVAEKYADRAGMYIRKQAYTAFKKMHTAAKSDDVNLIIRSATRNFSYQKGIWERKWSGKTKLSDGVNAATEINIEEDRAKKILNYSAMPGASRHHWGTDIDLNSFNNRYFESGEGLKIYQWLIKHAHTFGYCQPYTPKQSGRTGYEEEKWHWSYTPLSKPLTAFMKLHMKDHHFSDFLGHKTAQEIGIVDLYVLGIDSSCK